jgi:DNA-binding MarR family transcriptional regulator
MAETAKAIYQAFTLPGEWILSVIGRFSPQAEEIMRVDHGAIIVPFVLSLLAWTLVIVAGLMISRMFRNFAWQTAAICRTLVWRVKMSLGSLKTRLIWKYRQFFPHRGDHGEMVSREEFDNIDIAVLRLLFQRGPGMAMSAPELAEKFSLRPAQIQHRLDSLMQNQMLRSVIGSTDGYENYRLTDSGLTFITMMQRQARVTPGVSPVSASGSG